MAKISRRQFLKVSSMAAAGVALAACGQAATSTPTTAPVQTGPTNTPVPTGPQRPSAWPVGDVPRNRTLNYYWQAAPAAGQFNPYAAAYNHQTGSALLYEPCAFYGAHADKEYLWLAESYKYNADSTQLDVTFRKGIKWSDGTAFKASDVVWSMTTLKTVPGLARAGTYAAELDTATAVDDLNLQIKLNQKDYRLFFKSLTFRFDLGDDTAIQPPQIYKDVAAADMLTFKVYDTAKGWPVSTGPYGIGTSTETVTNYDLRPTWWAVDTGFLPAYPDVWRLSQTLYTNDTNAAQGLINNDYDQTLDLRPMVCASTIAQASDHLTTWTGNKMPYGYMDWWPLSIWFTTPTKPWDNPDVRWAVAYAIDQQAVVDIAWGGAGLPSNKPFPGFALLNKYMDSIKDITDKYNVLEFNLDKSAALMQKAGFTKDKDGFWVDSAGVRPTANLQAPVPLFGDLGPVVVSQLRAGGFDSAHKAPPDMWTAYADGRDAMALCGHGGSTKDPYDTLHLYRKDAIKPLGVDCGDNRSRWTDPTFEAALQEMNNTATDDPKMYDLFKTCMQVYYEQLPDCPLVQWFHRIPVNTTYWTNWPNAENPYMNSALWHLTCLYLVSNLKATNHA
jgi:peptide/nickel transport system substrate-binding protein